VDQLKKKTKQLDLDELEEKHKLRALFEREREEARLKGIDLAVPEGLDGFDYSEDEVSIEDVEDKVRK